MRLPNKLTSIFKNLQGGDQVEIWGLELRSQTARPTRDNTRTSWIPES